MASFDPDFEEYHPRAEDIRLTPTNDTLKDQMLAGIERVVTSDFSFTVEVEELDWNPKKKFLEIPFPKYLARVAFLKLDTPASDEADDDFNLELEAKPEPNEAPPLFQLAVEVKAYGLDKEKAIKLSQDEVEESTLIWPDGLRLNLINPQFENIARWDFGYQRSMDHFSFTGSKSGYVLTDSPKQHPVHMAYGIDDYYRTSGTGITEDGMNYMDEFRVINQILQNGRFDMETAERFASAVENSPVVTLLNRDIDVLRGSLPYFKRIIAGAVTTPRFRNMLASRQYLEQRGI